MGFLGFGKKKEDSAEARGETAPEREEELFNEPCGLCGKQPTDTKWMGQYWHKRCRRSAKRMAKGMMR